MKCWLKEHKDGLLIALFVVIFLVGGAVLDHYIPGGGSGGMTLSEMEALVQEYQSSCAASN